jgi:isochorismate hydrolase
VPPLTNAVEGAVEAGFPDEIAPRPEDYGFLKRRPSAFYETGVAELIHMLRRDTIIIGGDATNRGVETSVREASNRDLASIVVRECCWSGDAAAYSLTRRWRCTRASAASTGSRRCCWSDRRSKISHSRRCRRNGVVAASVALRECCGCACAGSASSAVNKTGMTQVS